MKARFLASLLALSAVMLLAADCSPRKTACNCTPAMSHARRTIAIRPAGERSAHRTRRTVRAADEYTDEYYESAPVAAAAYARSYYDYHSRSYSSRAPGDDGRRAHRAHRERREYGYGAEGREDYSDFTGGVGYNGGDGFVDGYGRAYAYAGAAIFVDGFGRVYAKGGAYDGPDYNGDRRYRGQGNMRFDPYSGYNFYNGLSNGY